MPTLIRTFRSGHDVQLAVTDLDLREHFLVLASCGGQLDVVPFSQGSAIVFVQPSRALILATGGAR
jgi:hypothetical protein